METAMYELVSRLWSVRRTFPIFALLYLFFPICLTAQNLLLNPSFENFSACPLGPSEFDNATNWQTPFLNIIGDTCSTSDLYNSCNPLGAFGVDVPNNIMGNQAPITGNGYAGIIATERFALLGCNSFFGSGWREYVEGTLSAPLVAGQTYCVTFHVSLADNVKYATDDFGVHFSNSLININCNTVGASSALQPLGFTPQLTWTGGNVTNTSGWTQMQWSYTASGGEQFVTFGNFQNDGGTSFICVNSGAFNPYAYYYVEDASVVPGACGVLPVELLSFEAEQLENGHVVLEWETASETNNAYFSLERSVDGTTWEPLRRVTGAGVSSTPRRYDAMDAAAPVERTYYKLSQTDTDGQVQFLQVTSVTVEKSPVSTEMQLFPNPVCAEVTVASPALANGDAGARLYIYDRMGAKVIDMSDVRADARGQVKVDVRHLPVGMYHAVLLQAGQRTRRSFFKACDRP